MKELLQTLPKVDELLRDPLFTQCKSKILKPLIQGELQKIREQILCNTLHSFCIHTLKSHLLSLYSKHTQSSVLPLVNATGVVLQTNLGRSLFSQEILDEVFPLLVRYNNLEYDIKQGKRGERYTHLKHLLCTLLGCEDAIVVNNNASAVLLVLSTFGKDKEVIISRGELVEIGGAFRIPEVMKLSGSKLVEVGTTNKTHLSDYEEAINTETSMLMKAHQSNFKQIGFTASVEFSALTDLAKQKGLIDYYDLGSGYMQGLCTNEEPSILELCKANPSLLSFSGDKLFGGPQAGIIIGRSALIAQLKKNHLLRALRIDKFTTLALEATLRAYLNEEFEKIPTLCMLNLSTEQIKQKTQALLSLLAPIPPLMSQTIVLDSLAGGGSLPQTPFKSYGISLSLPNLKASVLEQKLRERGIIARIIQEKVCLDLRCIQESEYIQIKEALEEISKEI
ncbi:L-seryl-tRNA(Sec) selenium transferase [Helicobacter cholecystus]|uniref:L-seryl-tRNA(Sec) selenium transferase n=1 Tax=Helicobacter cholecystus TaxID=45498 RepID=UPI0027389FAD|nr:L-seryl-tRNA(Sec) selenium transferase [Helicobacter cholecystus]